MRFVKIIAVLGIIPFLAACMSAAPETGPNPYTVSKVDVVLVDGAQVIGRFKKDEALRDQALAKIDASVTQRAKTIPGGDKVAKAQVAVTHMQLRNAGSRTIGGINSIGGHVIITDASGDVLSRSNYVSVSSQMAQPMTINGVPVGLLANLAVSSTRTESGADVDILVNSFADKALVEMQRGFAQSARTRAAVPTAQATAATVSAKPSASTTTAAAGSASGEPLSQGQLQAEIELAQQRAETEVLKRYNNYPCWQAKCEREVRQARAEAEARVRQTYGAPSARSVPSVPKQQVTQGRLQSEIESAQQSAENDVLRRYNNYQCCYPCRTSKCRDEVELARVEAEARVRQRYVVN